LKSKPTKWPVKIRTGNTTVSVYRSKHAKTREKLVYTVAWRDPGIGNKRRLQQFADMQTALGNAQEKAASLNAGHVDASQLTGDDCAELKLARELAGDTPVISALREWKRIRELTGNRGIQIAEAWEAANGNASEGKIHVADAVAAFITGKNEDGLQGEQTYKSKLALFTKAFGHRTPASLDETELSAFLRTIPDPTTRNDIRKRCGTFFRWARDTKKWLPRGVPLAIEATSRAKEPKRRIGIITPEEFRACLEWVQTNKPKHLAALVLAGFCGLRSAEIHGKRIKLKGQKRGTRSLGQLWRDIQLDAGLLNVSDAKENTPQWRLVPVCPAATAWLRICPRREDGRVCRAAAMECVRKGCIGAGIELPKNCFRHSYISHRIAVTGDKARVATEAGNSVAVIDQRYRVPLPETRGKAWLEIFPQA
jgi:integrase